MKLSLFLCTVAVLAFGCGPSMTQEQIDSALHVGLSPDAPGGLNRCAPASDLRVTAETGEGGSVLVELSAVEESAGIGSVVWHPYDSNASPSRVEVEAVTGYAGWSTLHMGAWHPLRLHAKFTPTLTLDDGEVMYGAPLERDYKLGD